MGNENHSSTKSSRNEKNLAHSSRAARLCSSADHKDFTNVVLTQKKLQRGKIFEQVLYMAVIKDALQTEIRPRFQFQDFLAHDVIAAVRRIRPCIFGVKKGQQNALGLEAFMDPFHHRLY